MYRSAELRVFVLLNPNPNAIKPRTPGLPSEKAVVLNLRVQYHSHPVTPMLLRAPVVAALSRSPAVAAVGVARRCRSGQAISGCTGSVACRRAVRAQVG